MDARTKLPISDVIVVAETVGMREFGVEPEYITTRSDSTGAYSFVPTSHAEILFAKVGYKTKRLRWPDDLKRSDKCPCCTEMEDAQLERR